MHFCPFHTKMEIQYYCTQCREALCENCKVELKHPSHTGEISEVTETAAALRQRLTERLRNLVPDDKGKEMDASLDHANDLLDAFEHDLVRRVSNIMTMIREKCEELLLKVNKRKLELISEGELRQKELVERQEFYRNRDNVSTAFQRILAGPRHALRSEDLLKMHPNLDELLTPHSINIEAERRSLLWMSTFTCQNLPELQRHFGVMGKIVDNSGIDLASCSFSSQVGYYGIAGEAVPLSVFVRDWRGQLVSERALKASSIQIWAIRIEGDFSRIATVHVPIIGYNSGQVNALFQNNCSQPAVFLLELLLDTPCPLPKRKWRSLANGIDIIEPLQTWLFVLKYRAVVFHPLSCSPRKYIQVTGIISKGSQRFAGLALNQVQSGVATIRANSPIQENDFGVLFRVGRSSELDIGFRWECEKTSQEVKLVLASSNKSHSSLSPICNLVARDYIHVTRCPHTQVKYDVDHYSYDGSLKNTHMVTVDSSSKPILMVRMFRYGSQVFVFEYNKKQLKQQFQYLRMNRLKGTN